MVVRLPKRVSAETSNLNPIAQAIPFTLLVRPSFLLPFEFLKSTCREIRYSPLLLRLSSQRLWAPASQVLDTFPILLL